MRKIGLVIVLVMFSGAQVAAGTVVEVPLPDLAGRYFIYEVYQRDCVFSLAVVPEVVHGAWLRLVGTATLRLTDCCLYPFEPYLEPFIFEGRMADTMTGGAWGCGLGRFESGAFDLTVPFAAWAGASWGFLLDDGVGEVQLAGDGCPKVDSCWPVTECSEAYVEQAFLVLDAEFPIPVEESTWGRIKALFLD
jgi:hypothetical protein